MRMCASVLPILSLCALCISEAIALDGDQIETDWLLQARLRYSTSGPGDMTAKLDAAGGCDGHIDGEWGFHTANEPNPWWQIDLGKSLPLDHILLYNRGGNFAKRAKRIQVWLGDRSDELARVYEHPGEVFFGHSDGKPLRINLQNHSARFLRLRLPTHSYFHLDEVEIFAADQPEQNVALHHPATQSSTSQWSKPPKGRQAEYHWPRVLDHTLRQGEALARDLAARDPGGIAGLLREWKNAAKAARSLGDNASPETQKFHYLALRRAIRKLLFQRPELDFTSILLTKRAPSQFPHLSDQYYGWWSRPGGGLYLLENFASDQPRLRCLTESFEPGNFLRPDLHFDTGRVLFAYARYYDEVPELKNKLAKADLPEDAFYQLFEMPLDGGPARRLTRGRYDDFDARYLPDDRIVFLSTRKGAFLQTSETNTARTLSCDLPDSYVRCGGNQFRPVPVYTLHSMTSDGGRMWPISAFETFEYTPSVAADGRILYCRWDYIDRFNGHFFSLWSSLPNGGNAQLVYGNYTKKPQATMEPRAIPGSDKIIFTASAHHSITGGSLVLLDPSRGLEGEEPLTRLTPEVPFPETEANADHFFANPWPLSEDVYLVSWSSAKLPRHRRSTGPENPVNAQGIYLYDRFGNLELLYRDPALSSMYPIPIRPRPRPASLPESMATMPKAEEPAGSFLLQDVYQGLRGVERGRIKRLRIVGVPPKVQPHMNKPSLGVSREETGKYLLGTVPVETDGSAFFQVPSGVPVFFQALDAEGRALQTMRSLTFVQPGQTLSCVGCHESRQNAPPRAHHPPVAALRTPSRLTPEPEGSWPLRFDRLVQPVLDRACLSCHQPEAEAASFALDAGKSHQNLLAYAEDDLKNLVFERDASLPGEGPSLNSRLLTYLSRDPVHREIKLSSEELRRLYAWMDTYGHTQGSFSPEQEAELEKMREKYSFLFAEQSL